MTLSKELHFTRAAEKLHISQPTLSHQIKALENEIGALLFDLLGKKISLTEAGKILYGQSLNIFRAIENTKLQINDLEMIKRGSLTIGALPGELINSTRSFGANPRKSAIPYSVTITSTSCSVWSRCETIGTTDEIAPPLA